MKMYHIPVVWQMYGIMHIEAKNLDEAKEIAQEAPLPPGDYVDDSFEIDEVGLEEYNERETRHAAKK